MKQSIFSLLLCLLFFSVTIEANLLPVVNGTSVCSSKAPCELRWTEDGTAPKLAELKADFDIKLMTGSNSNQIQVMSLGKAPPTIGKIVYKIQPNLGPPGRFYFYKFTSGTVEVWSSRFIIQDIQGTIQGFDPASINAKGDVIGNSTNSTQKATSASSSITTTNNVTTMGLSIIAMIVISYFC